MRLMKGEREERKGGRRFWRAGLGGKHIIFKEVGYIYISSGINNCLQYTNKVKSFRIDSGMHVCVM